jgi:MFS family permease
MERESGVIPVTEAASAPRLPMHVRYLRLLRANANFRRLWLAQLVSEIGDWFYSLAVYDLLLQTTHSGKAVSYAIIIQTLPWFFMTPLAGHLVDRFSRRRLMILADVARGFVVLGLLRARSRSDAGLVYALLGLEVVFSSFFEPARNAIVPNVTSAEEVLPANALSSATWSFALASGAALGGLVTALLGRRLAFVVNSVSFFASALLIQSIRIDEPHLEPPLKPPGEPGDRPGVSRLRAGGQYIRQNPKVAALILAKTGLGFLSGALLLLAIFGERVFPVAGHGALAMGLLYAARGIGAGIGPLLGDRFTAGRQERMWKVISVGFFIIGASYLALSCAPNIVMAALCVLCAHAGGSNVWVVSTTLLQLNVPDRLRGRVFAVDLGLLMLMVSTSNYLIGVGLDAWKLTARELAAALGCALIVPGLLWLPAQGKWGKSQELEVRS